MNRIDSHVLQPSETSLLSIAERKLLSLSEAIGQPQVFHQAMRGVTAMTAPWGAWAVERGPYWPSDLTDDSSPFEFSLAFHESHIDLRFLMESQSAPVTHASGWEAGLLLNERLAKQYGADLSQFNAIKNLFAPKASTLPGFVLWHSAVFHGDGSPPMFKAYLNPKVLGPKASTRLVERALSELGLEHAWQFIAANIDNSSRPIYFSLDLVAPEQARTKIYIAHLDANAADLATRVRGAPGTLFGDTSSLLETLTGTTGPFSARPILTCYAFRSQRADPKLTLHVPLRCYVRNDREAVDRICKILTEEQADILHRASTAIADRPLESGRGLITYVSLRPERSGCCVTVYLSPELYALAHARPWSAPPTSEVPKNSMIRDLKPASPSALLTLEDVQATVINHQRVLARHPFLGRLERNVTFEQAVLVAKRLAFFVMCFQDVLRLTHSLMKDPEIKQIAELHAREDAGHDRWYLHDLERFGIACEVSWLFSKDHERTRDVAYSQISDVLRSTDDRSRIAVALSLEAAGSEFFRRMIGALERLGQADGLKYFARNHEEVERGHEIFDMATQERFRRISVPSTVSNEVLEVVGRTFASMTRLADDLEAALAMCDSARDRSQHLVA